MLKFSPASYKQLVKLFEADGFRCVRTEVDHTPASEAACARQRLTNQLLHRIPIHIRQPHLPALISERQLRMIHSE